jgi:hypothetical protein
MKHNTVYWKQSNGSMIDIDLMDENHLRNTLKMIVMNNNKHKTYKLNGSVDAGANAFNTDIDYHEFESDLGYMFNDDEARGNQWN